MLWRNTIWNELKKDSAHYECVTHRQILIKNSYFIAIFSFVRMKKNFIPNWIIFNLKIWLLQIGEKQVNIFWKEKKKKKKEMISCNVITKNLIEEFYLKRLTWLFVYFFFTWFIDRSHVMRVPPCDLRPCFGTKNKKLHLMTMANLNI